jgi:hypothetical protein
MNSKLAKLKSGYLYVLIHPSAPELFKVGITVRTPEERLAQHNSDYSQLAGRIVQETGQLWELKEFHRVPDPYFAESVFWSNTRFADIPYRRGIEIERMTWVEANEDGADRPVADDEAALQDSGRGFEMG